MAGCLNGRRLVLVTVVWFWQRSSPTCLPVCLSACPPAYLPACVWFNSGEGSARSKALIDSNSFSIAVCWLYIQMWLSGVPPYEALIRFDLVTGWYQGSSSIQSID